MLDGRDGRLSVVVCLQIMEIVGYSCRLVSHYHPFVVDYFVVQYFFIVCSPVFFVRRRLCVSETLRS